MGATEIVGAFDDGFGKVPVFEEVHKSHHFRARAADTVRGGLGVEYGNADESKTRQTVVVTRGQWQTGPLLGLIFRSRLGEEFEKPFAGTRWIESDRWKLLGGSVLVSWLSKFSLRQGPPSAGEEFFRHGASAFHCGNVWCKHAVNILGPNAQSLSCVEQPISCGQATDDDDMRMDRGRDGGSYLRQHFSRGDFSRFNVPGSKGRFRCSVLRN